MDTANPKPAANARLQREIERERAERLKHDAERAGTGLDDEFRMKDARDSATSSGLQRTRPR